MGIAIFASLLVTGHPALASQDAGCAANLKDKAAMIPYPTTIHATNDDRGDLALRTADQQATGAVRVKVR